MNGLIRFAFCHSRSCLHAHVHLTSHYFRFLSRHQQINYIMYLLSCPHNNYNTYNICYSNKVTYNNANNNFGFECTTFLGFWSTPVHDALLVGKFS